MKGFVFILILLLIVPSLNAQDNNKLSRKEKRADKEEIKKEQIRKLLNSKTFVFNATHANPLGSGSIYLSSYYDLKITGDSVIAYLPFFGVAYRADYGGKNGGIKFEELMKNYGKKKIKSGTLIEFKVDNMKDSYLISMTISDIGYASVNISSNNKQAISFYGTIDEINEK
jgi:hypothetical protein